MKRSNKKKCVSVFFRPEQMTDTARHWIEKEGVFGFGKGQVIYIVRLTLWLPPFCWKKKGSALKRGWFVA